MLSCPHSWLVTHYGGGFTAKTVQPLPKVMYYVFGCQHEAAVEPQAKLLKGSGSSLVSSSLFEYWINFRNTICLSIFNGRLYQFFEENRTGWFAKWWSSNSTEIKPENTDWRMSLGRDLHLDFLRFVNPGLFQIVKWLWAPELLVVYS